MNFIKTPIEGVIIVEPRVFNDPRGYFFESYNEKEFKANGIDCDFVQDNQSKSSYGVIRGLHCQSAQQPKQNSDRHEGDDTGNAMENGRYRRDGEPDGL